MFTQQIIDSDAFLDMPLSSQALYFQLSMRADDDGFINNPKKIQRMIGAADDDLRILIGKRFVLVFESGVIVIKHWRMHNTLKGDRYTPTQYQEEYKSLALKGNKSYTENDNISSIQPGDIVETEWNQVGTRMEPEWNQNGTTVKKSIEKNSVDIDKSRENKPTRKKYGSHGRVLLSDDHYKKLVEEFGQQAITDIIEKMDNWIAMKGKSPYSDYNLALRKWIKEEPKPGIQKKLPNKSEFNNYDQRTYDFDVLEKKLLGWREEDE